MTNNIRERLNTALAGGPVEHPVYAVYDWFVNNRNIDWQSLFQEGLGQINHANFIQYDLPNVSIKENVSKHTYMYIYIYVFIRCLNNYRKTAF